MSIHDDSSGRSAAVAHAEIGGDSWRSVAHAQRAATPDHSDWYAITGELVDTLRCLAAVASVLAQQAEGYGRGRVLRDDAGADPASRLVEAWSLGVQLRAEIDIAERTANRFWSAIGHIAVEVGP
ncbi:hypothetical protein [Pseudonocardia sp.]|uniref:hypothetical protein n=1 Tax=Pseudonocardia sp. TaxID=60912 RepID=UPI003D0B7E65